jgi:hypothetical protein
MICFDTEQGLFSDLYDEAFKEFLVKNLAHRVPLFENCRNTREVAAYGHGVGRVPSDAKSNINGPVPDFFYYEKTHDLEKELKRQVNRLVKEFRDAGLDESRITLLIATRGPFEEMLKRMRKDFLCPCEWLAPDKEISEGSIQLSTVQAFKGLESDAVLLLGLESLGLDWQRKLFYVAATRAKSILQVFLPKEASSYIEDSSGEIMQLIV